METTKKTLEFSIQKTVTEEQFITTNFITDNESPFRFVSYKKLIRLPKYEKIAQLEWCDVIQNHVSKVRRRLVEKAVYENVTEQADIFDYMYYGQKYITKDVKLHNGFLHMYTNAPENLKKIIDDFRSNILKEKGIDKPINISIDRSETFDVNKGGNHSTDFTTYTLILKIKIKY